MGSGLSLFALLQAVAPLPAAAPPADPVAAYESLTSVEPRCKTGPSGGDILVCARRGADRYRVPFLLPTRGDPKNLMPKDETARLLYRNQPCDELNAFGHVGCGMVGVTVSTNLGTGEIQQREPAP